MKTSQALYEALEAVSDLKAAMDWDVTDLETKPSGIAWIVVNCRDAAQAYGLLEGLRDSLNEVE